MAVIPIYNAYHPVLRAKANKIEEMTADVKRLVDDMWDTLYNCGNGVGLAGNQIGEQKAITVIDINRDENDFPGIKPITMINPVIEAYSDEEDEMQEGCLSIPEFFEQVLRPAEIEVRYWDVDMKEHHESYGGFLARVMQHEIDHLNGILFFDRLTAVKRALSKSKLRKIEHGEVYATYPMINPDGSLVEPLLISD